ncbi:MAG: aspartyl protease family protein [Prolixibacteraceae bacterium]
MARKKSHTFPIQLITLEDENYHILIETEFQHQHKGKWAIDTGASKSVFDENQKDCYQLSPVLNMDVQSAGIGEMQIETQNGILPVLKLGDLLLNNWPVAIIDLQYVNKLYEQFTNETIFGLLGSDFLVQHQAKIDYKKLVLTLYF